MNLEELEAVKGLTGNWHLARYDDWDNTGNQLRTLCGTAISPNYRRFHSILHLKLCDKCRQAYNTTQGGA